MPEAGSPEPSRHRSAFTEPLFRRYFPAGCFSTTGTWLIRFLLGWSAWETTQSPFWVGIVAGAMLFPTFLLSPLFGIISDRINPRNGLLITVFMAGLVCAAAGIAQGAGVFDLPLLLFLSACLGSVASAHTPIRLALIPRLVGRDALPSAIGYSAIVFNTSRIVGPAIGAWLITHSSTSMAYLAAGLCFVIAMGLLLRVKGIQPPEQHEKSALMDDLKAGLAYVSSHYDIRLILTFTLINGLLGRTILEMLPAVSGQLLNGDSRTLALLTAAAGVGSITGGLIVSRQSGSEQRLLILIVGSLLAGAAILTGVNWLQGLVAVCALVTVISMVTTVVGTCSQALAQLLVSEQYRGRVLSLWAVLAMGSPAIGALVMGALAEVLGFQVVLSIFGLIAIPAILVVYRRRSRLLTGGNKLSG